MNKVQTARKSELGYEFIVLCDGLNVGDEVLVFEQYKRVPYGIAKVLSHKTNAIGFFNMEVTEVFE